MDEWEGKVIHMTRTAEQHLTDLTGALSTLDLGKLSGWGSGLANGLSGGGRLLAAGNGGSATHAQHLTAELIGRYRADRSPLSALALHAETSTVTTAGNDCGFDGIFARQVLAHGRPNDVLQVISTSDTSADPYRAVRAARDPGMTTWALSGPLPNPLASLCDDAVAVTAESAGQCPGVSAGSYPPAVCGG